MLQHKKLSDPSITPEEEDALLRDFITMEGNDRLRTRWERLLSDKYNVTRGLSSGNESAKAGSGLRHYGKLYAALAMAASLLIAITVWNTLQPPYGPDLLATSQFMLTPENYRSGNSEGQVAKLRQELVRAFNAGDLKTAQSKGESLIQLEGATPTDELNLGIACLSGKNYGKAIAHFQHVLDISPLYRTEALYYLGVSRLRSGNISEGRLTLAQIKETDGQRLYQKSQTLLQAKWPGE